MKKLMPALTFCLCILLSGCWNSVELNELGIVSATAIDYKDGVYHTSYQIVNPPSISNTTGAGGGNMAPINVFTTQGTTLRDAAQKASLEFPRTLFFAHNRILVISEAAAKEGISTILDMYLRTQESRETVSVYVTRNNTRDILKMLMPLEKIQGSGVLKMTNVAEQQSSMVNRMRIYQVAMNTTSHSASTLIPEVSLTGKGELQQSTDAWNKTSSEAVLKFRRNAVFKKDRLVGWLEAPESLGVHLATNEAKGTSVSIVCPKGEGHVGFQVTDSKSRMKTKPSENGMIVQVKVQSSGIVNESDCKLDLGKPESVANIKKELEKQMETVILDAWKSSVKLKADVFGISNLIFRKEPKVWKQWEKSGEIKWTTVELQPQVKVDIERTGMSNDSFRNLIGK